MQKSKTSIILSLAFLCLIWPSISHASLKGTYTIDPSKSASSTNYKNIGSAVSDLMTGSRNDGGSANGKGISGSVTFNIASGTYNEQVRIGKIAGATLFTTVTFQSAANDSSKVILSYAASNRTSLGNYTLLFDSAQYVTIKRITVTRSGSGVAGRVIELKGATKGINILNSRIIGVPNSEILDLSECIYSGSGRDSLSTISNNIIRYGTYGLLWRGPNQYAPKINTKIKGNVFDSTLLSIEAVYQNNLTIDGNLSINSRNGNFADMQFLFCNDNILIQNNKIISANISSGFSFEYCQASKYGGFLVANNVISITSPNFSSGIAVQEVLNHTYFYNTISINNGSCLVILGGYKVDITIYNNIFYSPAGNFFQGSASGYSISSNFNNIYQNGTLSGWNSGNEKNSTFLNPQFRNALDFHAQNPILQGVATNITSIKNDIEAKKRNASKPYPGAYEYSPIKTDIGILSLDSPAYAPCPGYYSVYASLYNYGNDTLKYATINFMVNGIPIGSSKWTGSIAKGQRSQVSLGLVKLSAGVSYTIKAWTSNPNGVTDSNSTNDTITLLNLKTGLSGTYTVGGTSPAYPTVKDAVNDLNKRGLCGAVTFSIRDGYYHGQLVINKIAGASASNTVTFQSENKDSSKVTIDFPSESYLPNGDECLLCLYSVSWINFKQITLSRSGNNLAGTVAKIFGSSNNISFSGCKIMGNKLSTTDLIQVGTGSGDTASIINFTLKNNLIKYGDVSFNAYKIVHNLSAQNNILDSVGQGFHLTGRNGLIKGNTIRCIIVQGISPGSHGAVDAYPAEGSTFEISYNKILMSNGIYAIRAASIVNATFNIFNNEIICNAPNNTPDVWLQGGDGRLYFANNSMLHYGPNASRSSAEFDCSGNNDSLIIRNNVIVNMSKWATADVNLSSGAGNKVISTNNDIYSNSPALVFYNSTPYKTLASYNTATGREANSVSTDPLFKSNSSLLPQSAKLDGAGLTAKLIADDINHNARSSSKPDMGAYEFTATVNDAGIAGLDSASQVLCTGASTISVILVNYGSKILSAASINWSLNGVSKTGFSWIGSLAQGQKTVVKLSGLSISTGAPYTIKVWTSTPNGSSDDNKANDTSITITSSGLNGIYTIGGSSPDYKSFNDAISDLKSRGACSPVIFKVRDGVYHENLVLTQFPGVSGGNTVTFTSENADSTKVSLLLTENLMDNLPLIQMNGADWITFSKMTLMGSDSSYNTTVIDLSGGAHHNSFLSCIIKGLSANSQFNQNSYAIDTRSQTKDSSNTIKNCHIYGNIYISPSSIKTTDALGNPISNIAAGNIIDNNLIESGYVNVANQDGVKVRGNQILGGSISISGINSSECSSNYINSKNTNAGLSVTGGTSGATAMLVSNNMINLSSAYSNAGYGIVCNNNSYCNIYNNNVNILSISGAALQTNGASNAKVQNNILVCKGGGAAWFNVGTAPASDYNNFYSNGPNLINDFSGGSYTLKSWRSATAHDQHSLNEVPFFVSDTDLHVKNVDMLGAGNSLSQVTVDFDNQARKTPPSIGADEFNGLIRDLQVYKIVSPQSYDCGDSQLVTKVMLVNVGINSLSNFTIGLRTSGAASYSFIDTVTQTINARDTLIYTFVKKMNVSSGGILNITVYNAYKPDQDHRNDTTRSTIFLQNKTGISSTVSAAGCPGTTMKIVASAASNKITRWFTASTGGIAIATGDTLTLKNVSANKTYYAQADNTNTISHIGIQDLSISAARYDKYVDGLYFNALTAFTLDSVSIYPDSSGTVTFYLWDAAGNQLNKVSRSYTVITPFQKIRLAIGFAVSASAYYRLTATLSKGGLATGIFTAQGKFQIPGIIDASMSYQYNTDYWFSNLFDFQITSGNAACGRRTPVKVIIDKPSFNLIKDKASQAIYDNSAKPLDMVCANNIAIYDVKSGYLNRDYNKTWKVSAYSLNTAHGTPGLDTAFTKTDTGSAAKIIFTPHTSMTDSTFILSVTVHSLISGCDSVYKRSIKVLPAPTAAFNFSNTCDGKAMIFTDASKGGPLTYAWNFGDNKSSTAQSPTHTYSGPGKYIVRLKVSNASGCIDSIFQSVEVYQRPKASFTSTGACAGSNISFTNKSTIPSGDSATYRWNFGDTTAINTATSPLHKFAHAGSYPVKLKVTTNHGCLDSSTKSLTINPVPDATFTYIANKKIYNFNGNDSSEISYNWDFGDSSTAGIQSPQHTYKNYGKYTVTFVVGNVYGCETTTQKTINVSPVSIDPVNSYLNKVNVFPNPFSNDLNVGFELTEQATVGLSVTDISGRELYRNDDKILSSGPHTMQLSNEQLNFSPGMYLLQIRINGNMFMTKPITKVSTR